MLEKKCLTHKNILVTLQKYDFGKREFITNLQPQLSSKEQKLKREIEILKT